MARKTLGRMVRTIFSKPMVFETRAWLEIVYIADLRGGSKRFGFGGGSRVYWLERCVGVCAREGQSVDVDLHIARSIRHRGYPSASIELKGRRCICIPCRPSLEKRLLGQGPGGGSTHHDGACHSHGAHTGSAFEKSARDTTSSHSTVDVVLATDAVDGRIHEVVDESDNTSRVAKERASSGDLVEDRVESQTESGIVNAKRTKQALASSQKTADGQTREISSASAVAEVI